MCSVEEEGEAVEGVDAVQAEVRRRIQSSGEWRGGRGSQRARLDGEALGGEPPVGALAEVSGAGVEDSCRVGPRSRSSVVTAAGRPW